MVTAVLIVLIILLILILFYFYYRRKAAVVLMGLRAEMRMDGKILLGPVPASYRGAEKYYTKVKNTGFIGLTANTLYFRSIIMKPSIEIKLDSIVSVESSKHFLSNYNARPAVIIHTKDNVLGFIVSDHSELINILSD
ncbi:MAG: hypothetical protein SVK54_01740 [candidate division WOR-3 bacterium]|nr:hypothetical protein [candidate division WOR-3 bacterium]